MISSDIRNQVRTKALTATSEKQIGSIIYATLLANDLHWREVDSDDVKQLLVDGISSFRHSREQDSLRVAV